MTSASARSVPLPVHWIRWAAAFVAVGAAIYLSAIVFAGAEDSLAAMQRLGAQTVLTGTTIASLAYFVRFARWQWLTARLGARLPVLFNFRVYLAGLALTATPGKAGEMLRSALLFKHGMTLPQSVGAFLADRGSDVIGIALLGAAGGLLARSREPVLEIIAVVLVMAVNLVALVVRHNKFPWLGAPIDRAGRPRPKWLEAFGAPVRCWSSIWTPGASVAYSLFAAVAYGAQAMVLGLYLQSLGFDLSAAACAKIFAVAMLLGAASMVPGGLGATEAALMYQLVNLGVPAPDAVAAALALRLSTLWFAILIGILALLSFASPRDAPK